MEKLPDYIQRRHGGSLGVRVRVPPELRQIIGKRELTKGLGTTCLAEANRKGFHGIIDSFLRQINDARPVPTRYVQIAHQPRSFQIGNLNPADVERIAAMIRSELPQVQIGSTRGVFGETGNPALWDWRPESEIPTIDLPLAGFSYEEGITLWVASEGTEPPADTTVGVYRSHLARFFGWLGHNEMNRVGDQNFIDYPAVLLTGADGGKRLANKSVNNNLASIRRVFRVAAQKRKITRDPTEGTIHKLPVPKKSPRAAGYTREEHATIIRHALALPGNDPIKWLWLLGATMGTRIGEPADATVEAVASEFGYSVLRINVAYRRNGLPLKTEGSERTVPLHSAVVAAGFLDYVAAIRAKHGDKAALFPQFNPNKDGYLAKQAGEKCLKWLRDVVGINGRWKDNHACRHTLNTLLTGRVEDRVRKWILGHDEGSVNNIYGETEIAVMADAIETIRVAC